MITSRVRILGILIVMLSVGSALRAQSPHLVNSRSLDRVISAIRPDEVAKAVRRVTLDDRVERAYADFERTGRARVVAPRHVGGAVVYPFGHTRPAVRCPRLNACVIALEPGEGLTDQPLSGDTERWIIDTSVKGSRPPTALVIVKAKDCDIATNLVIPTDRRVYELSLVSDSCGDAGGIETYSRQVKFWYPDEMLAAQTAESKRVPEVSRDSSGIHASAIASASHVDLNRDYEIDRGWFLNRKQYPWIPVDVFDDGIRTHIVLPASARAVELPILYLLEDGEKHVLNYALHGDTIVADRVMRRAVLLVNTGEDEQTIEIENRAPFRREERNP